MLGMTFVLHFNKQSTVLQRAIGMETVASLMTVMVLSSFTFVFGNFGKVAVRLELVLTITSSLSLTIGVSSI
jgi:hypothetical protein